MRMLSATKRGGGTTRRERRTNPEIIVRGGGDVAATDAVEGGGKGGKATAGSRVRVFRLGVRKKEMKEQCNFSFFFSFFSCSFDFFLFFDFFKNIYVGHILFFKGIRKRGSDTKNDVGWKEF